MSDKIVDVDFISSASESCIEGFCSTKGQFTALKNLQDEPTDSQPLKRRIIAVHEGTHNGLEFRPKEIKAMVKAAQDIKKSEKLEFFRTPIILDHSPNFLDKVGATFGLNSGKHPDDGKEAAIADIDFWTSTPVLREVAERVRLDPENTFFSVRVRGKIGEDDDGDFLYDMQLIHIAVVNEPADQGAKMISELKAEKGISDFPLNKGKGNEENNKKIKGDDHMDEKEIEELKTDLQKEYDDKLTAREAELKEELQAELKEQEELIGARTEILALDSEVDKDMLISFNKEQLAKFKEDLERRMTTTVSTAKSTEEQSAEATADELATKYFGALDEPTKEEVN